MVGPEMHTVDGEEVSGIPPVKKVEVGVQRNVLICLNEDVDCGSVVEHFAPSRSTKRLRHDLTSSPIGRCGIFPPGILDTMVQLRRKSDPS